MIEFKLPDMSCGHCVKAVTATVHKLDPQARLEFDLPNRAVRIQTADPEAVGSEAFSTALSAEGYPPAA
ncbi:MAG: heavy-metal-associated domain-containing protein [Ideonella sp.]|nr:heavy-metal-associated domain-containing protein [Ideonella sp.]